MKKTLKELQYFYDTNVGAWVTDRPEKIPKELKDKYFWRLK